MTPAQQDRDLEKAYRASLLIHAVFLVAPAVYVVLIMVLDGNEMLPHDRFREGATLRWLAPTVLAAATVGVLFSREFWARRGARSALRRGQTVAEALATAHLMRNSFNELIAVFGLLVYLLTANVWHAVPFIVVGSLALVRARPRKEQWRRMVTRGRL